MLASAKLAIELSETRQKIHTMLGKEDKLTEAEHTEMAALTERMAGAEIEYRAAVTTESAETAASKAANEDGEAAELRHLRQRVNIGGYAKAALEFRGAVGAELEYLQAFKMKENQFPLILLAPEPEIRAETDVDTHTLPQSWLDRLFAETDAARIGVSFQSVAPGVASFPVTTAGPSGAQRARMEETSISTWTVDVLEGRPKSHSNHLVYSKEDAKRLPDLEDSLTRDLRMALTESVDIAVFKGDTGADGTDADITGLQTASDVVEKTLTQANKVKHVNTLQAFMELVDGKHAGAPGDLQIVSSVPANVLWATTIANSAAENQTLAQFLMASGINWTTRAEIDNGTGNNKFGAYIGRGRGLAGSGVAPVWAAGELTRDDLTGARKREVSLTLDTYWDFVIVRASNFARLKFTT